MKGDIQKILEISVNAPSGSNSQPWSFHVRGNQIDIIAHPEKDHPILNFRNRGTWIAHGALIENIKIAAAALGYKLSIKNFPDSQNPNLTARISFTESLPPSEESLFRVIPKRTTNRKPYEIKSLTYKQKEELLKSVQEIGGGVEMRLTEDREKVKVLGQAGAVNEIVTLENKVLHKLFFDEIVWTREEEDARKKGLYLKTMELKPPQEKALKLFKSWKIMNFLNKFGVARGIAKGNARVYASTPVMGAILVNDSDKDFIIAGRLMERLWLKATAWGFGFHIITGVLFFHQKIKAGKTKDFSDKHIKLINDAYEKTASIFGVGNKLVAIMFRIGDGGEPTARSTKKPPEITFE